jgi:hypothetical protein
MPKRKNKIRSFYIDTNVALDYATNRDIDTVMLLESIKAKNWRCISSTFLAMEMADYKKEDLFVERARSKKWEFRKILREKDNKDLRAVDFENVIDWFVDFKKRYKKIEMYDFLQDKESWQLAQEISFNSNLTAPDVIHLTSGIWAALGGLCNIFITRDNLLRKEGGKILAMYKLRNKLKIMSVAEVKNKYFKK